jgi:DNA-binding transcriptional LysR family regulator
MNVSIGTRLPPRLRIVGSLRRKGAISLLRFQRVLSTYAPINRRLAIAGLGLTLSFEANVRDAIESGELVRVLEKFCQPFPGYYLYYPQRRQASRALRAFIEYLREWKEATRKRKRAR